MINIIIAVILIWLVVLTFLFVRIFVHYKNLVKGVGSGNLNEVLNKILERQSLNKDEILNIKNQIGAIERKNLMNVQKISFLRFNPFNETGGDNSFTLAVLDGRADGIILTGLHTREKTRMYGKEIIKGKSKYELSKEEVKVLERAMKQNAN